MGWEFALFALLGVLGGGTDVMKSSSSVKESAEDSSDKATFASGSAVSTQVV